MIRYLLWSIERANLGLPSPASASKEKYDISVVHDTQVALLRGCNSFLTKSKKDCIFRWTRPAAVCLVIFGENCHPRFKHLQAPSTSKLPYLGNHPANSPEQFRVNSLGSPSLFCGAILEEGGISAYSKTWFRNVRTKGSWDSSLPFRYNAFTSPCFRSVNNDCFPSEIGMRGHAPI